MQKNISEHDTLNLKEDRQKITQGAAPVSKPLRNVSMQQRIKVFLKINMGSTQYWQGVPNNVTSECILLVSVRSCLH